MADHAVRMVLDHSDQTPRAICTCGIDFEADWNWSEAGILKKMRELHGMPEDGAIESHLAWECRP